MTADYSILCLDHDGKFTTERIVIGGTCTTLMLSWSIGLPAGMFLLMYRVRKEIIAEDPDTLNMFEFMVSSFKR